MVTDTKKIINREVSMGDAVIDGLLSGMLAGLAMVAYLLVYAWVSGMGLLDILALFAPSAESRALVGVLAHLAVSGIYGALFGLGYAVLLRRKDFSPSTWVYAVIGALYGLLLLAAAWLVLLPATGSQMQEIPLIHLAIGHLLYGALLGLLVYRGARRTGDTT
jgi:hypothetical protein